MPDWWSLRSSLLDVFQQRPVASGFQRWEISVANEIWFGAQVAQGGYSALGPKRIRRMGRPPWALNVNSWGKEFLASSS